MIRPKGKQWQVDVTCQGKRFRPEYGTREEAESIELQLQQLAREGRKKDRLGLPSDSLARAYELVNKSPSSASSTRGKTLREALESAYEHRWSSEAKSADELKAKAEMCLKVIGENTPLSQIKVDAFHRLSEVFKKQGNSNSTINRKLSAFSVLLKHSEEQGWIKQAPRFRRMRENQGRLRWYTQEEEQTILEWFKGAGRTDMYDLTVFLVDTGLRLGEALKLPYKDCDMENRQIHVWDRKADNPIAVPMTQRVFEILHKRKRPGHLRVFRELHQHKVTRQWNQMRGHVGLAEDPQAVVHTLRHTTASRLVQGGVPLQVVQQWLGHKSISMTMRYAHLAPENLKVGLQVLEQTG